MHQPGIVCYRAAMASGTLRDLVDAHTALHADADGATATPIPGLSMLRAAATTALMHVIYRPLVCLILQGAKQVTTAAATFEFRQGQSAVITADIPALSQVSDASRSRPYLSVAVDLDLALLLELAPQLHAQPEPETDLPLLLDQTDAAAADAVLRLVRLMDRPEAIPVLHPVILREFHYWIVTGRHGRAVMTLARPDSQASRVARAMSVLRAEFNRPLRVERLAAAAGMSLSSFHQHFRTITSLSPIQFQKRLRLIEARRLMLTQARSTSQAAFDVGYESVPQFTREYGRMFGNPPASDMRHSRAPVARPLALPLPAARRIE